MKTLPDILLEAFLDPKNAATLIDDNRVGDDNHPTRVYLDGGWDFEKITDHIVESLKQIGMGITVTNEELFDKTIRETVDARLKEERT
jgi:hypothetical protein